MSRRRYRPELTAGLPHVDLPHAPPPKRVPGVVDLIKTTVAEKVKALDALAQPNAHKLIMAALSTHDRRKAERLLTERRRAAIRIAQIDITLHRMDLTVELRYKKHPRLTATSTYGQRLYSAFRTMREARVAALRALYTAALTDTLGKSAAEAGKYLEKWRRDVERV